MSETARPARSELASAIAPTSGGATRNARRMSHVTIVRPTPGRSPGIRSACCIASGIVGAQPKPASTKPAHAPHTVGTPIARPMPPAMSTPATVTTARAPKRSTRRSLTMRPTNCAPTRPTKPAAASEAGAPISSLR